MTILVTGCRGAVARHLVPLLLDRGLAVRTASRSPGDPATVRCDLTDPATFPAALAGVTSVFLYARADHADAFVKEAVAAGVEHVVLLSSSAVLAPDAERSPIAKSHADVEAALLASPLHSTLLRPGAFAANAGAWAPAIRSGSPVGLPFPHSHSAPIHEADIAEAALAVLTGPAPAGRGYTLTGPESLTFADQLDTLARATGRAVTVRPVTRAEWKAEAVDHVPDPIAEALLDWWQASDGTPVETTSAVRDLTGRPARSFARWAEDHAAEFTD